MVGGAAWHYWAKIVVGGKRTTKHLDVQCDKRSRDCCLVISAGCPMKETFCIIIVQYVNVEYKALQNDSPRVIES